MSQKNNDSRPPEDTPEFEEWLDKKAAKHIFSGEPVTFDERGPIFGDINDLGKSDAELFPNELEEYTPEERGKSFKLHKNESDK